MKGSWDSDRDPLTALREGDPAPFEAFVAAESATFLGFFRRLGASPGEAEDLVQELFLKMFRHAETYVPSGRFAAFSFRIARNAWIDRQRRRAAAPRAWTEEQEADGWRALAGARDPSAAPGDALEREEEAARVRRAMARLPEHQRIVFELGVLQELAYEEIAGLLDVPVGTVKSRMFYAVRRLREELESGSKGTDTAGIERRSAS